MNSKTIIILIFTLSFIVYANEEQIEEKILKILPPSSTIESIEKSDFPGIFKVYYGDIQPLYVSSDGNYFIYGEMFKIGTSKIENLTNKEILQKRLSVLKNIESNELISFQSRQEKYLITIFTDVDCGYCRKLHNQIQEYNNLGISINYAAFPRSGIGTESFTKMVSAWCSEDPKSSITILKKDKNLAPNFCDTQPIAKHYSIGKKIGITGTPAIITEKGELFPGYYPPKELLEKLGG
tara:strand:- start:29398 stop:30111 length:714 start_codon:yes stop_codon:yes gene_type:complete